MDFKQAEERFKELKARFTAGTLSEDDFKTQLEELMVQDEGGSWWMIGYETEKWYRNDGTNWVQSDPPASFSQKSPRIPNWIAIFWIMLGFGLGWAVGGVSIILSGDLPAVLVIAWVISWAIGGFATAITLHFKHALISWKSVFWITLGWAIAFLIGLAILLAINFPIGLVGFGGSVGLIGGGIGGAVTGITLRNENILSNQKSMLWTTLAWSIGGSIGAVIGFSIGLSIGPIIGMTISDGHIGDLVGLSIGLGIGGAISGGIGGLVSIWQIKKR